LINEFIHERQLLCLEIPSGNLGSPFFGDHTHQTLVNIRSTLTLFLFFANRSVPIVSPDSIDCQAVTRKITHADNETPADLLDAICLIDELTNAVAFELLIDRVPGYALGLEQGG